VEEDRRRICVRGIIYKNGLLFCQELKNSDPVAINIKISFFMFFNLK
jgi:hypothetical protein